MEELCQDICLRFETGPINESELFYELGLLAKLLTKSIARFVDIDSSFREDAKLNELVFEHLSKQFQDENLLNVLFKIYGILKNYLGLKYKYGEAADWFLKNEFDLYLEKDLNRALALGPNSY